MITLVKPNHYETLGLTPAATDDDIAEAYAARINKYLVPPDEADPSLRDEARQFMLAYRTLSDPSKRQAYDASLAPEPEPQGPPEARPNSEVTPFIAATPQGRMEHGEPAAEGQAEREDNEHSSAVAAQGYTLGYFARKHNLSRQFMLAYRTLSDPSKRRAYDASLAPEPEPQGPPEARPDSEVAPFIAATPQGRMEEGPPDLSAWSDPNHRAEPAAEGQAEREDNEQSSAVAAQGYTLGYFARKHNLSREQARELMARVGNDREKLNEAAEQLKAAPEPSPAPEPSQPSELSAAPEPSQASELSAAPEPSQASELSPAPEPSPAPPADRSDYAYHEQTRWAPAVDPSSEPRARRLPAAAKAGAALVGVGLVAVSALLLGGYLELPGSTPRQSAPPSLTTSADGSMATGNAMPQPTVPEQDMSQLPGGLDPTPLETVAPTGSETAPASAELAQSVQAMPPDAAVEKQPSGPAPSRAGQSADAPQARARAGTTATRSSEELAALPAPPAAAQPVVTQALNSPPASPNLRALPKWLGGGIGNSDNPRGRFRGIVSVQFTVDRNGQVAGCRTAASSGNPVLDSRTCQLVEQRLRFSPALDAQGRPVSWTMGATYMWGHKNWGRRRR